ncbi:hypothetical protein ACP8HI_00865 [Paenibacillus sp. FA6]|uniref:hypothetical protein n=1 Tax=Paenibacillus sp. FA6 TaxID=3413029 RepID=UPI003F659456
MNRYNFSLSSRLIVLACLIFDIAMVISFFAFFGLFILIDPMKSILMLLVLLMGLVIINGAVAFPNVLLQKMGVAYSTYIIFLLILYVIVSNVLSVFLIAGSMLWYVVWELLVLALFLGLLAITGFFSKGISDDMSKVVVEQMVKQSLNMQLMDIEEMMIAKKHNDRMLPIIDLFAKLKERINASTPFMRISGNSAVSDVENQIRGNLEYLRTMIEASSTDNHADDAQGLIEETRRLIIRREQLMIK